MNVSSTPNKTLLFIGDSITDCGRRDQHAPLGNGYVRLVADMLKLHSPSQDLRVINRGIGGHTIHDLCARWTDHVLCEAPDCLVVKIGINDCNRYLSNPDANAQQSPQQFSEIYNQIIALTRETLPNTKILIVSPFILSVDQQYPDSYRAKIRKELDKYIESSNSVANTHKASYLDLNEKFAQLLKQLKPSDLAEDAVHPNSAGTLFIAQHIFAALCEAKLV